MSSEIRLPTGEAGEFTLFALGGPKGIAAARVLSAATVEDARSAARQMLMAHPDADLIEILQGMELREVLRR